MQALRYVICDVFTSTPLTGNPLAVFTNSKGLGAAQMQALARELNLSETTFVSPATDGGHAKVRIFTPEKELPFAGHPTLGTAFVLGSGVGVSPIRLELGIGIVPVTLEHEGGRPSFGWMQQPLPTRRTTEAPQAVLRALGIEASRLPIEDYTNGPRHTLVEAASPEALASLEPDLSALAKASHDSVSVFARKPDGGVKARVFCPAVGIAEDPATGSAAGPLAVHLAQHGVTRWGEQIRIEQGTELKRPSELFAEAHGSDAAVTEVRVGGSAVVVARGEFRYARRSAPL